MPELPEVETVTLSLRPKVVGHRISRVEIFLEKVIKEPNPDRFKEEVAGRKIAGLKRRGKYLLFELEGNLVLVIHLRLSGQLVYTFPDAPRAKHTHAIFYLDNGAELRFQDLRQFGTMHLIPHEHLNKFRPLAILGPDALDPALTRDLFKRRMMGRKGQIKKLLLDQTFITGIGNIYADEILWRARIHPERPVDTLNSWERGRLYRVMRDILMRAIEHRGTTLRDYVDGEGQPGGYQALLAVHGRENEPCPSCRTLIVRVKNGGRSSYFCPHCQK
ncbi:MAG: bifunctional DNA-formamidopyrimidine glycosylase/DNA-(apurinic or apyrimidinic site) lyase [Bacillota bacterium]|nr:bifunctional DNA-formamidopyrimidine glycosylase/DNA-(apurinic or apyrimidinic site) lyase [Bacillota bacterium]